MTWNPDADGVLGLQWPVTVESAYAVDSPTKAAGARVRSHGAETIDKASMHVAAVAGSAGYLMEVWPVTVTESPEVTTTYYKPNEDVVASNLKNESGTVVTATNGFGKIDDDGTLDLTDYLRDDASGAGEWAGRFNVGSDLAGRQILRVEILADVLAPAGLFPNYDLYFNIGGVKYQRTVSSGLDDTQQELSHGYDYNPSTGLPWTVADVQALDTTDEGGFIEYGNGTLHTRTQRVRLKVTHVPEQRIAFGKTTIAAVGPVEFNLSTPTGGGTWAKADATDYLFTVRRLTGTGSASFRYLDSLDDCPHEHSGYAVQFSGADGRLLELGAEFTRAHTLIITTSAPATSPDSQPYASLVLAEVHTSHPVEQEFDAVAENFGVVRFVVAGEAGVPAEDLSIKIRVRAGGAQIGTTMTVTPEELTGTPTTLRLMTVSMPAATLTAAQHYAEFTSAAADGAGWVVAALDTTGTGSSATFGDTSQAATIGGVEDTDIDVAVIVAQVPAAPTGLAVDVIVGQDGHQYHRLTWNPTSLAADFDHYELERDDTGVSRQIAGPTTESIDEFDDYEARRGTEAAFLLRVVHANGIPSDYAGPVSATAESNGYLAFVSNEAPELNLLFLDQPSRDFVNLDHPTVVELYDRDGAIAFRQIEQRLDAFTRKLIVGAGLDSVDPPLTGRQALQPLLDLCKAALSYVCVLDEEGNRWFASVDVIDAIPSTRYSPFVVTVQIRELTVTPSAPDVIPE